MGTKKSGSIWGNANTNLKSRPPIFWIASAHCSVHKTFDVMVITKKVFGMQPQMWIITVSHAANNYESQWTEQRRQKPTIRWDNFIVYIVIPKLHRNNSMRACEIAEGSGVIETNWKRKTSKKWNRNGKVQFWSVIKQTKKNKCNRRDIKRQNGNYGNGVREWMVFSERANPSPKPRPNKLKSLSAGGRSGEWKITKWWLILA